MNPCETPPTAVAEPAPRPLDSAVSPVVAQFLRYLVVGGVATLADFGTLALLTSGFGWHYLQSAAVAFGVGTAGNYALSIRWVFEERAVKNHLLEFVLFLLIGLAGLGINQLLLWKLTDGLHVHYLQSKLVATAVVLVWNFSARKLLLFTAPKSIAP
jgi:putative flippase GtrA